MLRNVEIEKTLIGLAMEDASLAARLSELPQNAFTTPDTVGAYLMIKNLLAEHKTPDLTTMVTRVHEDNPEMKTMFMECVRMGISSAMYDQHEASLLDLRKRRMIRAACCKTVEMIEDQSEDVEVLADKLSTVLNDNGAKPQSVSSEDAVIEFIEDLNRKEDKVDTGIAGIDRLVGGLRGGQYIALGARPGVGKSALGLSISTHVARTSGPVLFVSREMTSTEIMARVIASETGVDMQKIVTKAYTEEEYELICRAIAPVSVTPLRFSMSRTPAQIRREAAAMMRNEGLKLITVDYIGLLSPDVPTKSKYESATAISNELKQIAMELNVPILVLTQFNRESETGGTSREPTMAEARNSGAIEEDANLFIIQYAPSEPKPTDDLYDYWACCEENGSELQILKVAKNRQGPKGSIMVQFDKRHMTFTTLRRE